jgi:hypothetical protein
MVFQITFDHPLSLQVLRSDRPKLINRSLSNRFWAHPLDAKDALLNDVLGERPEI